MLTDDLRPQTELEQEIAATVAWRVGSGCTFGYAFLTRSVLSWDQALAPPNLEWLLASLLVGGSCGALAYLTIYLIQLRGEVADPPPASPPPLRLGFSGVTPLEPPPPYLQEVMGEDGRFPTAGKTAVPDVYGITSEQLLLVARARAAGRLPTLSLTALDELGIDRKQRASEGDSDAHRLLHFLTRFELVRSSGARRPYVWTSEGERLFPSPDATPAAVV